jgi:hypothetical protein
MADKILEQQVISNVNNTQFSGMGFIGIKKVEYFSKDSESVIFGDMMELLENRNYTNNLMLGFFSVKPFGTEKVEKVDSILAMNEEMNEITIKQGLKKAALFDFADAEETVAGEVKILIVADAIIHWDNSGSYIQPTQENSFLLDLIDITKDYPHSYKITIYTKKDLSGFTERKFEQKDVLDVPLKDNMWYNQPNFQETYGTAFLTAGIMLLAATYGAMNWQTSTMKDLSSKISNTDLLNIKESLDYNGLYSIITKDISNSLSKSGFKLDSFEISPAEQKDMMLVKATSQENSHTQFSVQEPLAKRILSNSQTIKAMRKKSTSDSKLTLEALVDLKEVKQATKNLNRKGD